MTETSNLDFEISYAEDTVTIKATLDSTPHQDKIQRVVTLEEALKRQKIPHDTRDEEVRVYLHNEGEVEKVLEGFRIFEKQDKIKETKLYVNKKIASDVEKKLKSIFPPPEAAISLKCTLSSAT